MHNPPGYAPNQRATNRPNEIASQSTPTAPNQLLTSPPNHSVYYYHYKADGGVELVPPPPQKQPLKKRPNASLLMYNENNELVPVVRNVTERKEDTTEQKSESAPCRDSDSSEYETCDELDEEAAAPRLEDAVEINELIESIDSGNEVNNVSGDSDETIRDNLFVSAGPDAVEIEDLIEKIDLENEVETNRDELLLSAGLDDAVDLDRDVNNVSGSSNETNRDILLVFAGPVDGAAKRHKKRKNKKQNKDGFQVKLENRFLTLENE